MQSLKSAWFVLVPFLLAMPACRSAGTQTPRPMVTSGHDSPPDPKSQSAELRRREAARSVTRLEALIALDRQAVATGELRLANVRSLFDAGRVTAPELQAAEQDLLEIRQTLLRHEQEVVEARATADS